jgi:TonB family protein
LPFIGSSQDYSTPGLSYEVNKVYPYISITKEKLKEAQTLTHLYADYKSSWVREYKLVEVLTRYKGRTRKAISKNDTLSQEQKDIMAEADVGADISVKVLYVPENTLVDNDIKEIVFTFTVEPESEAKYVGGQQQLLQYLKEKAIDNIPDDCFKGFDLAAVKFTINEEGEITDARVFETSKDQEVDRLLVDAIRNMPCWQPAEYANGKKVKQEFVLTVGNMENCMVNLLNIRRDIN